MDWSWLWFLTDPAFVIAWYLFGIASAAWAAVDMQRNNRQVDKAVQWAWPIIIVFFSAIGLLLYLTTSRPFGIGKDDDRQQAKRFEQYSQARFRKVTASVIHCVGGDGLGIMTAMIIARLTSMSFWEEYWFEYAAGYAFGWFIFQFVAMKMMTASNLRALWMAGRAEFFSMMTVMAGMGVVMGSITPHVAGQQPKPYTFAFWGFSALGLILGALLTYPMNWLLVAIGWKHGLGLKARKTQERMKEAA